MKVCRAFSLVELLVVLAILVVLAALLFPVFLRSGARAREAACLSNLKQVGLAAGLYLGDHDGRFPMSVNGVERIEPRFDAGRNGRDANRYPAHPEAYGRYAGSLEVFRCPSDVGGAVRSADAGKPLHTVNAGSSYLFADLLDGQEPQRWSDPAQLVYGTDGANHWHAPEAKGDPSVPGKAHRLHYDFHVEANGYASFDQADRPTQ